MKLVGKRLVSAMLGLLLVLSLVACGGSAEVTVQDYVESSDFQQELASIKPQVEAQGLTVEVTAQGNTLTYVYTYLEEYSAEQLELIAQNLALSESALTEVLKGVYDSTSQAVSNPDDVVVVMTYCAADGQELYTQSYPS